MRQKAVVIALAVFTVTLGGCSAHWPQARVVDAPSLGHRMEGAEAHLQRGLADFEAERYGRALAAFRAVLVREPGSARALNGIGATYDMLGRHELAQQYFARALAAAPTAPETLNNLGYSFLLQKEYERANTYLEQASRWAQNEKTPLSARIRNNLTATREARRRLARSAGRQLDAVPEVSAVAPMHRLTRVSRSVYLIHLAAPTQARTPRPTPLIQPLAAAARRAGMQRRADAAAPSPDKPGAVELIEVSNGAGRRGMAARMRAHLASEGIKVKRLTNAKSYGNATSTIFYREGQRHHAERIAALLPLPCALVQDNAQYAHVRLRIGGDLLDFDQSLIRQKEGQKI